MLCPNCRNLILGDSNHCSSCGKQINNIESNRIPSNIEIIRRAEENNGQIDDPLELDMNVYSKKINGLKAFIMILFAVGIVIFVAVTVFDMVNSDFRSDFVTLGEDKIPSAYEKFGNVNICKSSKASYNGVRTEVSFTFCDSDVTADELDDYLDFLLDEGFEIIESDYSRSVYKYAIDENYILVVSVDYANSSLHYEKRVSDDLLEYSVGV